MNDLKEKRALVRKIVRARPKSPGELCAGCVWRMAESGRVVCPFPRCVRRSTDEPERSSKRY